MTKRTKHLLLVEIETPTAVGQQQARVLLIEYLAKRAPMKNFSGGIKFKRVGVMSMAHIGMTADALTRHLPTQETSDDQA